MPGSGLDTKGITEVVENIASVPKGPALLEEIELKSGKPLKNNITYKLSVILTMFQKFGKEKRWAEGDCQSFKKRGLEPIQNKESIIFTISDGQGREREHLEK